MPKHDHLHTLDIQTRYPEAVWQALNQAAHAHEDQKRKNTDEWYISHPYRVMEYTMQATDDIDVHIAAVLHDTVEDTHMTLDDITAEYGETIAWYVWGVTKDDTIEDWKERNLAYLERLEFEAHANSSIIALADKIANIEDLIRDYKVMGDALWEKFNAGPEQQFWWFSSVLQVAKNRLGTSPLIDRLEELIEEFETEVLGTRVNFEPFKHVGYDEGVC